jgi:pimeloyl-[acyl-carrier protein] methyl ester esterase
MRLLLLPGMDGTGELFREFVAALPAGMTVDTVLYPADAVLPYERLMPLVLAHVPVDEPWVMVAESYSTPLAIRIAAMRPGNLKGVVLCAGFATSPLKGWLHGLTGILPLRGLRLMFPEFVARKFLLGEDAPQALVTAVAAEIEWVEPKVLAARVREVLHCDVREELARIVAPMQYLRAAEDRLVDVECLEEILAIQPGTLVAVVDGPHLLLQREAGFCAGVVAEFVRGLVVEL